MKLTNFDRTLIHGLGLMSRPRLISEPADNRMVIEIIAKSADRASSGDALAPLLREARRLTENLNDPRYIAHHVATAMNEFDRQCMAAHWAAARGE